MDLGLPDLKFGAHSDAKPESTFAECALARFQAGSIGRTRPVLVALATDATESIRARCEASGMHDCIQKPIEPAALLARLRQLARDPAAALQTDRRNSSETIRCSDPAAVGPVPGAPTEPVPTAEDTAASPGRAPSTATPAIDRRTLGSLGELGGEEFVDELCRQFIDDARGVLRRLAATVQAQDVPGFREQAHALRSAAANIGAQRIFEMCLGWREIDAARLERDGSTYLGTLEREFERVRSALADARAPYDPVEASLRASPPAAVAGILPGRATCNVR